MNLTGNLLTYQLHDLNPDICKHLDDTFGIRLCCLLTAVFNDVLALKLSMVILIYRLSGGGS